MGWRWEVVERAVRGDGGGRWSKERFDGMEGGLGSSGEREGDFFKLV